MTQTLKTSSLLQANQSPVVLRLKGLVKHYGAVTAVDHLNLEIRRGEFFTLLGPSGSGKSSTLLLIAGFEAATAGEVYLDEQPMSGVPAYRRRIGVVFQNYALFPHLTVLENVAFALRNLRWPERKLRAQVQEMLSLVQLEGLEERMPAQLSGGQQQRVALARALAFRPSLLLLDEPLGALDRKLREHMLVEFRRIHRVVGTTMIYVSHDQEEALAMSDRIGVMNHGRLLRIGTPRELYEDPGDPFVADFLGEVNYLAGASRGAHTVVLDDNESAVTIPCDVPPGIPVRILMRPEKVMISAAPRGWNSIYGHVEEVVYLGDATKYRIRTRRGQLVRVKCLNRHLDPACEVGSDVILSWHPFDCRVVRDDTE